MKNTLDLINEYMTRFGGYAGLAAIVFNIIQYAFYKKLDKHSKKFEYLIAKDLESFKSDLGVKEQSNISKFHKTFEAIERANKICSDMIFEIQFLLAVNDNFDEFVEKIIDSKNKEAPFDVFNKTNFLRYQLAQQIGYDSILFPQNIYDAFLSICELSYDIHMKYLSLVYIIKSHERLEMINDLSINGKNKYDLIINSIDILKTDYAALVNKIRKVIAAKIE